MKEKILKMDQENTNLRNQLIENSENILLLQATLQASDKENEANIKTAIEQKDSELLFKVVHHHVVTTSHPSYHLSRSIC